MTVGSRIYVVVRSAWYWFLLAVVTCAVVLPYLIVTALSPAGGLARKLERFWAWFILRASRVRLSAHSLEHVEPGRSYVVMANHLSLYDIPVLHYLLGRDRDLRWIGKRELLSIPLFGLGFERSRHVAIDRQNPERAVAALKEAAASSAEGVSFAIMPEGTRSADGKLGPFKKGGFHLAIDTGLPILPVTIVGSDELQRKGSWHILPGSIEVRVLPLIPVEGLDKGDVDDLLARTRSAIESELERYEPEAIERSRR
jgi:1-acyl-sn-glycerol-3-phosphate acyltransferase